MIAVSVIIPLHNKGQYIHETLHSVQDQTLSRWECIVVENGSSDDGPVRAAQAAQIDSRIRLIRAPETVRGPGAARNLGLQHSTGDWVLFLDADDLLPPDYLEAMLNKALEIQETMVVAAPWREFAAGTDSEDTVTKRPAGMASNGARLEDSAIAYTCWAVHAALVRRSWLLGRNWPEELDGYLAEDTAFWFRVVLGAKVSYADLPGALYRTGTTNCRSNYEAAAWFEGNHRATNANLKYLRSINRELSTGQIETLVRAYESLYTRADAVGNRSVAIRALKEANRWMHELRLSPGPHKLTMRLRRLCGLPFFNRIRGLALRSSNTKKV